MKRVVVIGALVGCYSPKPHAGAQCASNGDCPSPFTCVAGFCGGSGSDLDAPLVDTRPDTPGMMIASNGVNPSFPGGGLDIAISGGIATFHTDTGLIEGVITRPAGTGIMAGIDFEQAMYMGQPLGVFAFHKLTVAATGKVHFTGAPAAVFAVNATASIDGEIDGSGGCYGATATCAGPGGGIGAHYNETAGSCGGGPGSHEASGGDGGGGGGGGGTAGAAGGVANNVATTPGAAGAGCLDPMLQPLVGGGGGGGGGPGATTGAAGGGGGGAFQLTVFGSLAITGKINMGGAGGEAGPAGTTIDGSGGGGGGAGGGILIESPTLTLGTATVLAANGGGGGGGAGAFLNGSPGSSGGANTTPAAGGAGTSSSSAGGDGGAGTTAPTEGGPNTYNTGGGGGAVGAIYIRAMSPTITGTISPAAGVGPLLTN